MHEPTSLFLIEEPEESLISRMRETFMVSMLLHIGGILFILMVPDLFTLTPTEQAALEIDPRDVTPLYAPPEPMPSPPAPAPPPQQAPPETASAQEQLMAPAIREVPMMEAAPETGEMETGEMSPEEMALEMPGEAPGLEGEGAEELAETPEIGLPEFEESVERQGDPEQPRLDALELMREPSEPTQAQLQFYDLVAPGRGTDALVEEMARQRASGEGPGITGGFPEADPNNPNFNLPGPQLLSDPRGVNFQPYMLRVYLIVRRNWYSMIPEIARLGRKGRVVLQFTIRKDGSVPDLNLEDRSGTVSMDTAAMSSIQLSNPFPPLPPEYDRDEIRLRFVYFYNIKAQ